MGFLRGDVELFVDFEAAASAWAKTNVGFRFDPNRRKRRVKENSDFECSVSNLGCFFVATEVLFFLRMRIILLSGRPRRTAVVTRLESTKPDQPER